MTKSVNKQTGLYLLLFFINVAVLNFYLFRHGVTLGWDTQFHLNRIEELYRSLKAGHLLPSNGTYSFSQIGLQINKFYPYLFLYPFALFRLLGNPIVGFEMCLSLFCLGSFVISYFSIFSITKSRRTGAIFSIIYNNSGYLLLQITQRGDIPEYVSLMLLPCLMVGTIGLLNNDKRWILLPLSLILVSYAHILSAIIFTLFITIFICPGMSTQAQHHGARP